MDEPTLTDRDFEIIQQRIQKTFPAEQIINEVFTRTESQQAFIEGLIELDKRNRQTKVGGRRLRDMSGGHTFDFAKVILRDAEQLRYDGICMARLGPLVDILDEYPQKRMIQPDLDFFIWGSSAEEIMEVFSSKGFKVSKHVATGGVWVVEVEGDSGVTTFVDGNKSWQTTEAWPMYGFKAEFNAETSPVFKLDISAARLHVYPLGAGALFKLDLLDPVRVASISRALLWAVTCGVYNQEGNVERLRPPVGGLADPYYNTVLHFGELIRFLERHTEQKVMYRSALRDFALAMRIIAFLDNDYEISFHHFSKEMVDFLQAIAYCWRVSKFRDYDRQEA